MEFGSGRLRDALRAMMPSSASPPEAGRSCTWRGQRSRRRLRCPEPRYWGAWWPSSWRWTSTYI